MTARTAPLVERMAEALKPFEDDMSNALLDGEFAELRGAMALAVARVLLNEPASDAMASAAREALRKGGLMPAYTDNTKNGQAPILHVLLKEAALNAASSALLKEIEG